METYKTDSNFKYFKNRNFVEVWIDKMPLGMVANDGQLSLTKRCIVDRTRGIDYYIVKQEVYKYYQEEIYVLTKEGGFEKAYASL